MSLWVGRILIEIKWNVVSTKQWWFYVGAELETSTPSLALAVCEDATTRKLSYRKDDRDAPYIWVP